MPLERYPPSPFQSVPFLTILQTGLRASCVYHGPKAEAIPLLAPILNLGPKETNITELPWNRLTAEGSFGWDAMICTPGGQHELFAANLRERNATAWVSMFNTMNDLFASTPGARKGTVLFEAWSNQAMKVVPDDETAYPWRDTQVYLYDYLLYLHCKWR